jgi:hypothetical protein
MYTDIVWPIDFMLHNYVHKCINLLFMWCSSKQRPIDEQVKILNDFLQVVFQ